MATKVFEDSSGQKKSSIRFGAGRLMTFKEAKTIPDYILKRNLAALEVKKDRLALKMKREEVSLEMTLETLNKSFGEYANVETAEDVRAELKRGIRKQMNAQREQAERAKAAEKAAHGGDDVPTGSDGESKTNARLPTPVREAMRRRKRDALARKQKRPRPKYSELKVDDMKKRQYNNSRSYDRLMESYGRGKNDERLEAWLDVMYPRMDHMSATIIGMKKRLERFQCREAMEAHPKEVGVDTLMHKYKVFSMYPEVLKERRVRRRGRRRGSESESSQDMESNQDSFQHLRKLPPIKSESTASIMDRSSLDGVSESDINLEVDSATRNGAIHPRDGHKKGRHGSDDGRHGSGSGSHGSGRGRRSSSGGRHGSGGSRSRRNSSKERDEGTPPVALPPAPKKGILHLPPIQATPNAKSAKQDPDAEEEEKAVAPAKRERKKVAIMTPIMSREATQLDEGGDPGDMTARDRQVEEDSLADFAAFKERMRQSVRRRSSSVPKTSAAAIAQAAENKKKIEEIKQQIIAMRRGEVKNEDFEMEMARRKSLMVLMGDDYDETDMEWLVEVEDPTELWRDVKSCRYLRGHDPDEMVVPDGPLGDFIFWKGDYAKESTFEKVQREKKEKKEEGLGEADSDADAINSVGNATRKSSTTRRPSIDNLKNGT